VVNPVEIERQRSGPECNAMTAIPNDVTTESYEELSAIRPCHGHATEAVFLDRLAHEPFKSLVVNGGSGSPRQKSGNICPDQPV
jgi:hypothetical protein